MGRITAFIIGAAAGAAASLLLTPRNGAENRALINQAVAENCKCPVSAQTQRKAKQKANQLVDAAATTSTKVINTVIDNGSDAYKAAASRVQQMTPPSAAAFNNSDELREKIDAARERIATQVAKNAEAARDAAVDAIPAAVDAAKGATDAAKGAVSAAKDTVTSATASVAAKINPAAQNAPADSAAQDAPAPSEPAEKAE